MSVFVLPRVDFESLAVLPVRAAQYLRVAGFSEDVEGGGTTVAGALEAMASARWQCAVVVELYRRQVRRGSLDQVEDRFCRSNEERADALAQVDTDDAALAEVFGPQWAEIMRLAIAGSCRFDRLRDAPEVAGARWWTSPQWSAALDAAGRAAIDGGRRHQYFAAFHMAHYVGQGVARIAAQDAARALVVRDLIGRHGFTGAHYDYLSGPWRRHVGALHPADDAAGVWK